MENATRRASSVASAQGIRTRHSRTCNATEGGRCNCTPTYEAWVYSKRDGKKIRKSFPTYAAAKTWRRDAGKLVADKKLRAPASTTLKQEAENWLELVRNGAVHSRAKEPYKPAVIRQYESALRLRVYPSLGSRRLSDIETRDLLELKEDLLGRGINGSTVRNTFVPLQAIFRRAVLNGTVPINPTINLDLPSGYNQRERIATPEEAGELIDALPESERPLWATAFYAGLRRGELRALRAENIDLETKIIRVEHGWDDQEGEIGTKSRRGRRTVPIPARLRPYLVDHLTLTARRGQDFAFGATAEAPFTPKNIRRKAARAWEKENEKREKLNEKRTDSEKLKLLEPITLHECRHTFVTLMFYAGLSLERIGDYVGHSSAYMTDRYRHLLEGHEAEAGAMLDKFLALSDTASRTQQLEASE
jgi:integrase